MITKKFHNRIFVIICGILLICSISVLWSYRLGPSKGHDQGLRVNKSHLKCSELPGADDIVILLKTGVNEVEKRLPVLLRTLLSCTKHGLVYSDVEQDFQGIHIHNALDHLPQYLEAEDSDLMHYNHLQEAYANGTVDAINRDAGWKLDRFKYMPMMQSAYKIYPNAKWYVFVETDTAVLWSNLVTWLSQMDPKVPKYLGSQVVGSKAPDGKDYIFAHGGSGFIVSQAAARMMVDALSTGEMKFFNFAKNDCCGDAALAKAFWELGILITPAFPNSSGETPDSVGNYDENWCFAPVFFHHMNQQQIEQVHLFDERKSYETTPLYADIFDEFVWKHLEDDRSEWDNFSGDKIIKEDNNKAVKSFEACRLACSRNRKCLQYNYRPGECRLSAKVRYGAGTNVGIKSGWDLQRIQSFRTKKGKCRPTWILG